MKEIEQHLIDKVEIVASQQERKQINFIGTVAKAKGLTLWEINLKAKSIIPATFTKETVALADLTDCSKTSTVIRHHLEMKENCFYVQAVNKENALRKCLKMLNA
jgi:ribosome maturation factor RimP